MSSKHVQLLEDNPDLWTSAAQAAVMFWLAWKQRPGDDHVEVSAKWIARRAGLKPARVFGIYNELEALYAIARIGSEDRDGHNNRIVLTIEKRIYALKSAAAAAAELRGDASRGISRLTPPLPSGDVSGLIPPYQPADRGEYACDLGGISRLIPVPGQSKEDKEDKVQEATPEAWRLASAEPIAADGNLPFLVPPKPVPHARDIDAANKVRLKRLRERVCGLARELLFNPTFAARLEALPKDERRGELTYATKELCRKKRVLGYGEVVNPMCASEYFKFTNRQVIYGAAPRPRDRRRVER